MADDLANLRDDVMLAIGALSQAIERTLQSAPQASRPILDIWREQIERSRTVLLQHGKNNAAALLEPLRNILEE